MNVMNQITSMKDSGISWIGKIPKHWRITRIKYLSTKISKGTTPTTIGQDFTDSGIRFIKAENIANGQVSETPPVFIDEKTHHLLRRSALNENDVLVVIAGATTGKAAHLNKNQLPANTNQAVAFVRAKDEASKSHILYSLFSRSIQEQISLSQVQSAQPNLSLEDLGNLVVTEPLPEEQKSIAQYLDRKTAAIDALIAKKQRLIELLEEKQSALIDYTITHGIPKTQVENSNVFEAFKSDPWLFTLPNGWVREKLKYNSYLKGRLGWQNLRSEEYVDEGPYLVTSEHFRNNEIHWDSCYHVTEERYRMAPEIWLKPDDVLMMKDGAAMGKLAYVWNLPGLACLNSHLLLFRPLKNRYLPRFLFYVLSSSVFRAYMINERTGTTFFGISQASISSFPLSFPAIKDQQQIVQFLDEQNNLINTSKNKILEQIKLIQEYRQSVITAAVTGKLDVTQAAVP